MNVGKFIRFSLAAALLSGSLAQAKLIGALGFVSPEYPNFGRYRPSQDTYEFFQDFIAEAYYTYSDAGVAVVNKLNIKRNEIQFKDVALDGTFLIPSEDNRDAIDRFYKRGNGVDFYRKIAQENKVDMILYSKFNKTKLKRTIRSRENPATLVYRIFVYDVQSGATKSAYLKVKVQDLFSLPDYDVEKLQTEFINSYIQIFQELVGHMQVIGSAYDETAQQQSSQSTGSDTTNNNDNGSDADANSDSGNW